MFGAIIPSPRSMPKRWRLKIEGEVEKPLELTYAELAEMETRTITVTMECAGNGRAFLEPQRDGAQWEGGAVGNAEWTGVPLAAVLARAGVQDSACEVILEGADQGEIKEPPRPSGKIHYSRSLPLQKANEDVLLALRMNGEALTPAHGFPLRAVVPGWYGMAAVKWLTRIVASSEPYHGYYQTIDYAYWERGSTSPTLLPITEMRVKAQIARPEFAEAVRAGQPYRVHGAAWTTEAEITRVEVSTDAGATWNDARLLGELAAQCLAALGIRVGGPRDSRQSRADGARHGFRRPHPARGAPRRPRQLSHPPLAPDRSLHPLIAALLLQTAASVIIYENPAQNLALAALTALPLTAMDCRTRKAIRRQNPQGRL